jgi:hypothetical protein
MLGCCHQGDDGCDPFIRVHPPSGHLGWFAHLKYWQGASVADIELYLR